jgi:LPXTG-motif cell wall-anchored protein
VSRGRATLIAGLLLITTLGLSSGVAQAQDYPGGPPAAGATCTVNITATGLLTPGATVSVTFTCNLITAGRTYTGSLQSTLVSLPATVAASNGTITFQNVKLPADWEVNHAHVGTLVDQGTGQTLGSDTFYVNKTGQITDPPKTNLPRTGTSNTAPFLRGGAALVALGGVVLLAARRRRAAVTPV